MQLLKIIIYFFLALLYYINLVSANEQNINFNENHIWLRVSKSRGNTFYRVFSSQEEKPFVDLTDLLNNYLDFTAFNCNLQTKFCSGLLPAQDKNRYWIDLDKKQCGDAEANQTKELTLGQLYVIEEDIIWINFELLNQCFPIEANWDKKLFYLSISPRYNLKEKTKELREQNILRTTLEENKKKMLQNRVPLKPTDPYYGHIKYKVEYNKPYQATEETTLVGADGVLDLYGGTVRAGFQADSSPGSTVTDYQTYILRDQKHFKVLEIGDSFFDSSNALIPDIITKNSIKLETRDQATNSAFSSTVKGRSLPNTELELYRNGIFIATQRVNADGTYFFENVVSSPGDNLILKFFYPDASYEEQNIKIATESAKLLEKNDHEFRFYSGETLQENRFSQGVFRFGIFQNFSSGLKIAHLEKPKINSSNPAIGSEEPFIIPEFLVLPSKYFTLFGETLIHNQGLDYFARLSTSILNAQTLNFQYKFIEDSSPLTNFQNIIRGEQFIINHAFNYKNLQLIDSYEKINNDQKYSVNLNYFVFNNLSFFSTYEKLVTTSFPIEQIAIGSRYRITDLSEAQVTKNIRDLNGSTLYELNIRGDFQNPWGARFNYIKFDQGSENKNFEFNYVLSRRLQIALNTDFKELGIRLTYNDLLSPERGPKYVEDFSLATVSGYVMSPKDKDGVSTPLSDVLINIDGRSVRTDQRGYYQLSGISTYKNVQIKIDPASLDVIYAPKLETELLYFRPGTHIEYNPEIVPTIGLDGIIEFDNTIDSKVPYIIDIKNSQTSEIVQTIYVEADGFFMIEGLAPTRYILELIDKNKGTVIDSLFLDVNDNTDWVRNYVWKVKGKKQ